MAFRPKLTHKIPLECCDNNSRDYQFDTQTLKLAKGKVAKTRLRNVLFGYQLIGFFFNFCGLKGERGLKPNADGCVGQMM